MRFKHIGRALTVQERFWLAMQGNLLRQTIEEYERYDFDDALNVLEFLRTCDATGVPFSTGELTEAQFELLLRCPLPIRLHFTPYDEGIEGYVLNEVWYRVVAALRPPSLDMTQLKSAIRDGWLPLDQVLRGSRPPAFRVSQMLRPFELLCSRLLQMPIRHEVRKRVRTEDWELYTTTQIPFLRGAWWVFNIQNVNVVVMPEKGWPRQRVNNGE